MTYRALQTIPFFAFFLEGEAELFAALSRGSRMLAFKLGYARFHAPIGL
ncbi:hypothetical protein [Mesorhizobium sp.]|nr:hypothetical protein [Mesorhizobium sp.]